MRRCASWPGNLQSLLQHLLPLHIALTLKLPLDTATLPRVFVGLHTALSYNSSPNCSQPDRSVPNRCVVPSHSLTSLDVSPDTKVLTTEPSKPNSLRPGVSALADVSITLVGRASAKRSGKVAAGRPREGGSLGCVVNKTGEGVLALASCAPPGCQTPWYQSN